VLNLRFGRTDAHDRAVRALGDINPSLELGGRVSFQYLNTQGIPVRTRVGVTLLGDSSGQASGVSILPFGNMWVPLSQDLFVGMGAMARFTTGGDNRTYFGITPAQSAASGLPVFTPSSGAAWVTAWPAVAWRFHPNWALGAGRFLHARRGRFGRQPDRAPRLAQPVDRRDRRGLPVVGATS
jgi:outer membrane protein